MLYSSETAMNSMSHGETNLMTGSYSGGILTKLRQNNCDSCFVGYESRNGVRTNLLEAASLCVV